MNSENSLVFICVSIVISIILLIIIEEQIESSHITHHYDLYNSEYFYYFFSRGVRKKYNYYLHDQNNLYTSILDDL